MVQFMTPAIKSTMIDSADEKDNSGNSTDQEVHNSSVKVEGQGKKRKRKQKGEKGGKVNGSHAKRRHSVSKPARDPRDNPSPTRPNLELAGTRSPSPVIDFDGLSRPSTCTLHGF